MNKFRFLALMILTIAGLASPIFGQETIQIFIVDVRTEEEWNNGHLEGAVLIPYGQIAEKIGSVAADKSRKIYLYCRTGRRARIAKETLEKLGYKDVVNLGSIESAARILKVRIVK